MSLMIKTGGKKWQKEMKKKHGEKRNLMWLKQPTNLIMYYDLEEILWDHPKCTENK